LAWNVTVVHDRKRNVIAEVMRQETGFFKCPLHKAMKRTLKKVNWIINLRREKKE
jgi:hypothetical protein